MSEPEFFYDIQQSSPEWFELRRGIPTASNFDTILANGKGREKLLLDLAGELLSGQVAEGFTSFAMQRGKEMEAEARDRWCRSRLRDAALCGFVRRKLKSGRYVGCSPDSLIKPQTKIDASGVLEVKTMLPRLMIATRKNGYDKRSLPEEHRAQCQGALWVTGYQYVELTTWYRGMPWALDYAEPRDEKYIRMLSGEVERFDNELNALVTECRGYK